MGSGSSKVAIGGIRNCTLWKTDMSPACRSVMMTLDALNLSVNEVDLNIARDEHITPDIKKMNCFQTLPILKDKELVLADSHVILTYLASRYSPGCSLLPLDHGPRARIEQQMMYNCGVLQPKFKSAAYPILYDCCRFVLPTNVSEVECSYGDLQTMLNGAKYFGGEAVALSDICLVATISTLNVLVPIDKIRFHELDEWLQRMSSEMFYLTANTKGLSEFSRRIDSKQYDENDDDIFMCPRTSKKRRLLSTGFPGLELFPVPLSGN